MDNDNENWKKTLSIEDRPWRQQIQIFVDLKIAQKMILNELELNEKLKN